MFTSAFLRFVLQDAALDFLRTRAVESVDGRYIHTPDVRRTECCTARGRRNVDGFNVHASHPLPRSRARTCAESVETLGNGCMTKRKHEICTGSSLAAWVDHHKTFLQSHVRRDMSAPTRRVRVVHLSWWKTAVPWLRLIRPRRIPGRPTCSIYALRGIWNVPSLKVSHLFSSGRRSGEWKTTDPQQHEHAGANPTVGGGTCSVVHMP